jgi:NAD(P)-dependent dehydrogenase (short-subunit alcohol dehydrogenase family)
VKEMLQGKVILVTGAGRGAGRAHALQLAKLGARLVINDLGADVRGEGSNAAPADAVVAEIHSAGGHATANHDDISDWRGAERAVRTGIEAFGKLDGLVNNAGNLRKGDLADLAEADFDSLVRVHLKGSFACTKHALHYWRERFNRGEQPNAAVVNTISDALLVSLPSCAAYGAVKGGIAHLTTCGSREALKYGVRINAYSPRALTRMTNVADADRGTAQVSKGHWKDPGNSSPLVAWLLSDQSSHVSGQVFQTIGGGIAKCAPWTPGLVLWPLKGAARFEPEEIGAALAAAVFGSRFPDLVPPEPPGFGAERASK